MADKINKFIRGNFLFLVIILAICFAFFKKATIWQQNTEKSIVKKDSLAVPDSIKIIK